MPPFKPLHLHLQQFQCGGFDGFKRQIYRLFLQQAEDAPPSRIAADGSEKLMPRPRQADSVTGKPIALLIAVAFVRNQSVLYQEAQMICGFFLCPTFDTGGNDPAVGVGFIFQFGQDMAYQIPVAFYFLSLKMF